MVGRRTAPTRLMLMLRVVFTQQMGLIAAVQPMRGHLAAKEPNKDFVFSLGAIMETVAAPVNDTKGK